MEPIGAFTTVVLLAPKMMAGLAAFFKLRVVLTWSIMVLLLLYSI